MQMPIKRTVMDIPTTVPVTGKLLVGSSAFASKRQKTGVKT